MIEYVLCWLVHGWQKCVLNRICSLYIYIYIYAYMNVCICGDIYLRTTKTVFKDLCVYAYVVIYTYMRIYICIYIENKFYWEHIICAYVVIYTYMRIYKYFPYIHSHTHIYTYIIYKYVLCRICSLLACPWLVIYTYMCHQRWLLGTH